jgi:hypothetical protein
MHPPEESEARRKAKQLREDFFRAHRDVPPEQLEKVRAMIYTVGPDGKQLYCKKISDTGTDMVSTPPHAF